MDEEVKTLLSELARTINAGLERSRGIAATVKRLEELGYQSAIYLEATILLSRPADGDEKKRRRPLARVQRGSLKLSREDLGFLKSLRIAIGERPKKEKKP